MLSVVLFSSDSCLSRLNSSIRTRPIRALLGSPHATPRKTKLLPTAALCFLSSQTQLTVVLGHYHSRFYKGLFHRVICEQGRVQMLGMLRIQQATHPGLELQN